MMNEMEADIQESLQRLMTYCEKENFRGWDPYDGLNSRIFQALPVIRDNRLARLAWIQLFKRNPVNLRKAALVPRELNPKGVALFLDGYCQLYRQSQKAEYLRRIEELSARLLELKSEGFSGTCFGYNFDWQAKAFFQPRYTPTVVATTFAGYALLDAFDITGDENLRQNALEIAGFILNDLNRTYDDDGDFAFSYSPLDHTRVFNATLLGSRMLSRLYHYSGNGKYLDAARKSVAFCCKHQKPDGSWAYSTLPYHQWIDNFHTGYNLECIAEYQKYSGDDTFRENLERGFRYYIDTFFTKEGIPRYYSQAVFPVDVHATAQLIVTLCRLGKCDGYHDTAAKVLGWTIRNMQAADGHFYYQKHRHYTIRAPYMRWTQAWMFYGMSLWTACCRQ